MTAFSPKISQIIGRFGQMGQMPERIYNPITAMGVSAMFTFQLDNTKEVNIAGTLLPLMGVVDTFGQ